MRHVRISKKGRELLNNPQLARAVVALTNEQKLRMQDGEVITVKAGGKEIKVTSATSIKLKKGNAESNN